jgi:hypothetical protein
MPTDLWLAVKVQLAFTACCDAQRFGLIAYLPVRKVHFRPKDVTTPMLRSRPLIPGHMFCPARQARGRELHFCRGVRPSPYLVEGWAVSGDAIKELSNAENADLFSAAYLSGNQIRLSGYELIAATAGEPLAGLFAPLFRRA